MATVVQDVTGDSALQTAIAALKAKLEAAEESSDISSAVSTINTALSNKQDKLTFDSTPSSGSSNPVTSGGVKTALDRKQDTLTFDSTPTAGSSNPVTSGGVKSALNAVQEALIFDAEPTAGSTNPVTSNGIKAALDAEMSRASNAEASKVNKPETNPNGTQGQMLQSDGIGGTVWSDVGTPTDAQVSSAITTWLNEHPEATTTVLNGSVTKDKLAPDVLEDIVNKAPAIMGAVTEVQNTNNVTDETQVTVYGNSFTNETVKIYNGAQFCINTFRTTDSSGINVSTDSDCLLVNGTKTSSSASVWIMTSATAMTIPDRLKGKTVTVKIVSDKTCTWPMYNSSTSGGFRAYIRKTGVTGDGSLRETFSIGSAVTNGYVSLSGTMNIEADDDVIYMLMCYVPSGSSFTNVHFRMMLYDSSASVTDTEETLANGAEATYSIPSGYTTVDTGCHKNALNGVLDTKEYVDNNIPSDVVTTAELTSYAQAYVPNATNRVFITPEMYGAVGDGSTDDSTALQNAINAAVTAGVPLYGFANYYLTTGIVIEGESLSVYIHKIDYRGNDDASVILRGRYNHLVIDYLYDYFADGSAAFRLETSSTVHADYNVIEIQNIYAYGNCVEYYNLYGESDGMHLYYNKFYSSQMYSRRANIFYFNGYQHFAENSFWGKNVSTSNGYFVYCDTKKAGNNTNRFYEFTLENSLANGVYGVATLINCRTTECMDKKLLSDQTIGNIFVVGNSWKAQDCKTQGSTIVDYESFIVEDAMSYDDTITYVQTLISNGKGKTPSFDAGFSGGDDYTISNCRRFYSANNDPVQSGYGSRVQFGKLIGYYNHKGFVPNYPVQETVENADYHTYSTTGRIPTIFDIGVTGSIYLDYSYCAVGIKEIRIIQRDGFTTKVYAKDGTTVIFDGTSLGDGTFIARCDMIPLEGMTITVDGTDYEYTEYYTGHIYTGMNEVWSVEKLNMIS